MKPNLENTTPPESTSSTGVPAALVSAVDWLIRLRIPLFLLCVVTAAIALGPSLRLEFDRSVEGLFHERDPRLVNYLEDKKLFGGAETAVVAYTDPGLLTAAGLKRVEQIDSALRKIAGVQSVLSLAQARLPGAPLNRKSLHDHLVGDGLGTDEFRKLLLGCDLYRGRLLSTDGKTTVLLVSLAPVHEGTPPRDQTIARIREVCEAHDPPAVLAGGPVLVEEVYEQLETDGVTLGLASSLVLTLVLALLFRNLRWILLPLVVVQITIVWTKALLVATGTQLSMVSSPLVALVTVIGVATVAHLTIRFREERERHSPTEAMRETLTHLGPAIFWTCLTTAGGFGALLACRIVPVQGFGMMMALGTMLVFVATLGLVPAGILLGRAHTDPGKAPGEAMLAAGLDRIARLVEERPALVAAIGLGILSLASIGIYRLEVATDFDENFREGSRIVRSYRFVTDRMGTTSMLDILIDAPKVSEPEKFNALVDNVRALQGELARQPGVARTMSVVDVLDFANSTRKDRAGPLELAGARVLERLGPAQRLAAVQALQPALVGAFWSRDHKVMRIIVQLGPIPGAKAKRHAIEAIEAQAKKLFPSARVASVDVLLTYMVQSLQSDQWTTFGLSIAAIVVMLGVAFRDWRLGLLSLIPNAAPILIVVGVMGWAGLKVNMATAMLASVSMGMTVDFSIHYLYRYRLERRAGKSVSQALRDVHGSVGLAMVLATIALMAGFSTLALSAFVPTVHFGILVSVAMLGGLLGNLTTLPLLLRWLDR